MNKSGLTDYSTYNMKPNQYAAGFIIGTVSGIIIFEIFFERIFFSLVAGMVIGVLSIKPYHKYLTAVRRKKLIIQFKDFLESLAASYSAGKNTNNAFKDAFKDMKELHGFDSAICTELEAIVRGLENGVTIEALINDFADRSGVDDIKSFANTFETGSKTGSNMRDIIFNTKEIISDKIEIEMEIKATIVDKKTELYIMMIMPFIILLALKGLGDSTFSASNPINMITRAFVLISILIAYLIGRKITDIKA